MVNNKNGSVELSMTTVIVIVMGVAILSLGLVWARTTIQNIIKLDCSKNPNAEGCVCDEYFDYRECSENCEKYYKNSGDRYNKNYQNCNWDCMDKLNGKSPHYCLRAHNPNECEKGNPNYVWENKTKINRGYIRDCCVNFDYYSKNYLNFTLYEYNESLKGYESIIKTTLMIKKDITQQEKEGRYVCVDNFDFNSSFNFISIEDKYILLDRCYNTQKTIEVQECRKKTDLELFKEKLDSYDCEKLLLDMTEECDILITFLNREHYCEYNYYEESDDKLKEIFMLKNCEVKW